MLRGGGRFLTIFYITTHLLMIIRGFADDLEFTRQPLMTTFVCEGPCLSSSTIASAQVYQGTRPEIWA